MREGSFSVFHLIGDEIQEEILYLITMKNESEANIYYSYNENLIKEVFIAINDGLEFINIENELLINVNELVSIEKVGE